VRPRPQPHRERDVPGQDVLAQFAAELHGQTLAGEVEDERRPS
jgi:hypothetical protein